VPLGLVEKVDEGIEILFGPCTADEAGGFLEEDSHRLTSLVACDLAVNRIGCLGSDACDGHGCRVGDQCMRVLGNQGDGMPGGGVVQFGGGGEAGVTPDVLIPATPGNPNPLGKRPCPGRYGVHRCFASEVSKVKLAEAARIPHQVSVGVGDTWNDARALHVLDDGIRDLLPRVCRAIESRDSAINDGHCLDKRAVGITRVYPGVVQDACFHRYVCSRSAMLCGHAAGPAYQAGPPPHTS